MNQDATAIHNTTTNVDFDFTPYNDMVMLVEVRVVGASKNGTAHLVDGYYAAGFCVVDNKNGVLAFCPRSLGFPATPNNPMVPADSNTPIREPLSTEGALRGGGGGGQNITLTVPGGVTFRVGLASPAPAQDCPVTVWLTIYAKASA